MNILVSNDDGIDAPGIAALRRAMDGLGTVYVVAPETEQSAQSHALTLARPLRVRQRDERIWAVSGTPADSVYVALHHLLPQPPDLVISGINRGGNLGNDVFYSGTVAAAMEGCLHELPAIAVSLARDLGERELHWDSAAHFARRVAVQALAGALKAGVLWNVNVPNSPLDQIHGLKACTLGRRRYSALVELRRDPRGGRYYWIGGEHKEFDPIPGTDGPAVEEGYAAITPMHPDLTLYREMDALKEFTDV